MTKKQKAPKVEVKTLEGLTIRDLTQQLIAESERQAFLNEIIQVYDAVSKWSLERNLSFEQAISFVISVHPFDLNETKEKEEESKK